MSHDAAAPPTNSEQKEGSADAGSNTADLPTKADADLLSLEPAKEEPPTATSSDSAAGKEGHLRQENGVASTEAESLVAEKEKLQEEEKAAADAIAAVAAAEKTKAEEKAAAAGAAAAAEAARVKADEDAAAMALKEKEVRRRKAIPCMT